MVAEEPWEIVQEEEEDPGPRLGKSQNKGAERPGPRRAVPATQAICHLGKMASAACSAGPVHPNNPTATGQG